MQNLVIYIIANAAMGTGMSGSDRIFIECARRWARDGCNVNIVVWEEGYQLCHKNKLDNVNYIVWSASRYKRLGFAFFYLVRVIKGCLFILKIKLPIGEKIVIYSASDFWMDSIPAWIMKRRNRDSKWVAGFYLFMPPLWDRDFPYKGRKTIIGLLYWITQKPIYYLIKRWADMVFVTSIPDKNKFVSKRLKPDRILVVQGGIDLELPKKVSEPKEKKYDAVFIGRFHPQKGVLELARIWAKVCAIKKSAKLAVIGEGPLEKEFREKVRELGTGDNVELLGFLDGLEKIKIFKSSRMVIHPAIYDSGGMAACEAMSCGLPGISFDLEALKTYYPKGMIKVSCYDIDRFAKEILKILGDGNVYGKLQREALDLAKEWDWDSRAKDILNTIESLWEESSL